MTTNKQSGFIARGGCAVLLMFVLTAALAMDVLTGQATGRDFAQYGWIWAGSIVATGVFLAFSKAKRQG